MAEFCCTCETVVLDKVPHPTMAFRGETRHFCSEECQAAFRVAKHI